MEKLKERPNGRTADEYFSRTLPSQSFFSLFTLSFSNNPDTEDDKTALAMPPNTFPFLEMLPELQCLVIGCTSSVDVTMLAMTCKGLHQRLAKHCLSTPKLLDAMVKEVYFSPSSLTSTLTTFSHFS